MSLASRVRSAVNELGWLNALLMALARVMRKLSFGSAWLQKYYLFAQPVRSATEQTIVRAPSIEVRRINADDPIVAFFPRDRAVIDTRFRTGALCFVATKEDQFVGYVWLQAGRYEEDEVRCLFLPDPAAEAIWDFDVYIEPRYRLSRAFAKLWGEVQSHLHAGGYRWTMSRVSAFNPASMAAHKRLDAREVGWGLFIVIGAVQISVFDRRPFLHVGAGASMRPTLRVSPPGK